MATTLTQTAHLNIRQFTINDAAFIFYLLNTPTCKQFIGERNINSQDDAEKYINNVPLSIYQKYGYGPWLVELSDTLQPIGLCGLFKRNYLDKPDLGFAFLPGFEGRGLAYEASMAVLAYVQDNYGFDYIYATTTAGNMRSQRLLTKCGFIRCGEVTPPDAETLLLYQLNLQ